MTKESILKHLESSGKFLVIGKNSYNVAKKIVELGTIGSTLFDSVNTLSEKGQQTFYGLLRVPKKIVIGTIQKEVKLPTIVKKTCMILRLKE